MQLVEEDRGKSEGVGAQTGDQVILDNRGEGLGLQYDAVEQGDRRGDGQERKAL